MAISVEHKASYDSLKELCLKIIRENSKEPIQELLNEEKIYPLTKGMDKESFLPIFHVVKSELEREVTADVSRNLSHHPDIQYYLSLVLEIMKKDFEDIIKNLKAELLQRDHELLDLLKRIDRLQASNKDTEQEIRFLKEEMSLYRSQIDLQKDDLLRKEKEYQKLREQMILMEGQQQLKEQNIHRLESDLKKQNEEVVKKDKELLEKQKTFIDMLAERKSLESRVQHFEGIIHVKEMSVAEINKSYLMEQEETKKVRKELSKKNEEIYALARELENTKNHLKMAKEDYINLKIRSEHSFMSNL